MKVYCMGKLQLPKKCVHFKAVGIMEFELEFSKANITAKKTTA